MLVKLEPYSARGCRFAARYLFISSEDVLLGLRTGNKIAIPYHHIGTVIPYDRFRDAWLPGFVVPYDFLPFKFLSFTGSRTFRMVSATFNRIGHFVHAVSIGVVTFTITEDFKSIILAAPPQAAIIRNVTELLEVHEVGGKLVVVSIEFGTNTVVHKVYGTMADEVACFPGRRIDHSCIINGMLIYIDGGGSRENHWQLFSYDFDTKEKIALPGKNWSRALTCRFSPNGKLFTFITGRSDDTRITVYDLSSNLEHSPSYVIHPVIPEAIDDIHAMPSGHISIWSHNDINETVWVMWIDPPTLAVLALAVIHLHLSEQVKRKLKNLEDPVVGYWRFVEILTT